jgi:hypothetical protein
MSLYYSPSLALLATGQPEAGCRNGNMPGSGARRRFSTRPLTLPVFLARLPPNPKFHHQEFPGFAGARL